MESLISKQITYALIKEKLGSEDKVIEYINNIRFPELKARLIDEARKFYAKQFKVQKDMVWYGDLSCADLDCSTPFPYSHVIGCLDLGSKAYDMTKLVYVTDIVSTGIQNFPNLEVIENEGNFNGTPHRQSYITSLPKLKVAPYLYCANSHIRDLGLKEAIKVNLTNSSIKKINLKVVEEDLSVSFSRIEDISSLKSVGNFNCRGTDIKVVNPGLEIFGKLHAENSNNFEDKITTEKHDCWHTDNGKI